MASQRKANKWSKVLRAKCAGTARLLLYKGKRFFSILALPFRSLQKKYLRWPRVLQVCSLYLLVLMLTGAVFLWRSAQLKTINPYIENLKMTDLEDGFLPEKGAKGAVREQDGEDETATTGAGSGGEKPRKDPAAPLRVVWPAQGRVLREFGDPVAAAHMDKKGRTYSMCRWLEIETEPGAEIVAIMSGTVEKIISSGYPGKAVKIKHENGRVVYYAALDKIKVAAGETVGCGQAIATVRPGEKAGPAYLHLEIREKGRSIDPRRVLPAP